MYADEEETEEIRRRLLSQTDDALRGAFGPLPGDEPPGPPAPVAAPDVRMPEPPEYSLREPMPDRPPMRQAPATEAAPAPEDDGWAKAQAASQEAGKGGWGRALAAFVAGAAGRPELGMQIAKRQDEDRQRPIREYLQRKALERQTLQDKRAGEAHGVQMDQARGAMAEKAAASDPSSPVNQVMQEAMRERFPGMVSDDLLARMTVANPTAMKLLESKGVTLEQLQAAADKRAAEMEDWRTKEAEELKNRMAFDDHAAANRIRVSGATGLGPHAAERMIAASKGEEVPFSGSGRVESPLQGEVAVMERRAELQGALQDPTFGPRLRDIFAQARGGRHKSKDDQDRMRDQIEAVLRDYKEEKVARRKAAGEYGERLIQTRIAEFEPAVNEVRQQLASAVGLPEGASLREIKKKVAEGADVPGYGATRVAPDWALSRGGKNLRKSYSRLKDLVLRIATGANAPEAEVKQVDNMMAAALGGTDMDMIEALEMAVRYVQGQREVIRKIVEAKAPGATRLYEEGRKRPSASHRIKVDGRVINLNSPPTPEQLERMRAAGHVVEEVR